MKSSTQHIESATTPGIFQPVFSGSSYGQSFHPYSGALAGQNAPAATRPAKQSRYANGQPQPSPPGVAPAPLMRKPSLARRMSPQVDHGMTLAAGPLPSTAAARAAPINYAGLGVPPKAPPHASSSNAFEPSFSLFGGGGAAAGPDQLAVPQDSWNIFSAHPDSQVHPAPSPEIGVVNLDFANELNAEGLADSLLNTAAAVAAQPAVAAGHVPPFQLPALLDSDLVGDHQLHALHCHQGSEAVGGRKAGAGSGVWSPPATSMIPTTGPLAGASDTSSTASSSPSAAALAAAGGTRYARDDQVVNRPELSEAMIEELNDVNEFKKDDRYQKHIIAYRETISFPIGEGGRELLRACLNVRGCKGRQLQGASVPVLLQLAHQWNLWDVALRIKIERQTGQLSPAHEAFVRFKATQSQMRKYVRKEYMVTERDQSGKIARIHYDENRKIKLGKDGRESLRAKLRRLHDKHANRMDELLAQHGFKYSELRNATVQQLGRMAFVCNLWDQVISACRSQEEKRDGRGNRLRGDAQIKLPLSLINEPIVTDENGEMSNDDARRTMAAVSELLQQNYAGGHAPDIFSSSTFARAFGDFATGDASPATDAAHDILHSNLVDIKQEPRDEDFGGGVEESSEPATTPSQQELLASAFNRFLAEADCPTHGAGSTAATSPSPLISNGADPSAAYASPPTAPAFTTFDPSTGGFF